MNLTKKQTLAVDYLEDSSTNELIFGGGAGGGKSAFGVYWLIKMCMKYPETRWLMGRAKLKTLKETTLNSFFEVAKIQGLEANVHFKFNSQSSTIHFSNGSDILIKDLFLYPSDPNFDELGSLEITGAFIDECNQIVVKAWQIVKSRIRYKLDEYNLIPKILGSCNPSKNWVYTDFYSPNDKGELAHNKKFIQALLTDNPHISVHYKENLKTLDEASKQRLLFGNWLYLDDPSILIDYENIINCFTNNFVDDGTAYITADIARFGRDKTVIGVWRGWRLFKIKVIPKSDLSFVKDEIEKLAMEHKVALSNIIVDEDGVGGGVVDFVKCKGFVNNASPLEVKNGLGSRKPENFNNLKSQCYFGISDRINSNQVYINAKCEVKESIIEELGWVKQKNMDKDTKKQVLSKEEIKEQLGRSPDFSDMIMMRYYFELVPKNKILWSV